MTNMRGTGAIYLLTGRMWYIVSTTFVLEKIIRNLAVYHIDPVAVVNIFF